LQSKAYSVHKFINTIAYSDPFLKRAQRPALQKNYRRRRAGLRARLFKAELNTSLDLGTRPLMRQGGGFAGIRGVRWGAWQRGQRQYANESCLV